MDIAEREAFFARGGGSNPPARGPPPMMPPARTPSDAGDWGPSPESQQMSRDRLARQRQAEYNEYLAQRQAHDAAHAASVRPNHLGPPNDAAGPRGGGSLRDHPTPAASDASPGLVFDEEQRPRPKGGLRDIHRSADAERLSRAAERKRRYAAELQQQMAERQRREQMEKSENRRADLATVGMGNVIRDMHDGRLDGVDENGVALGYDYGQVHAPPGARPYHPAPPTDPHGDHQPHGGHGAEETPTDPRRHHPPDSGRFGGGAPAGPLHPPSVSAEASLAARRKAEYQRDLDAQVAANAARKAMEKRVEAARDAAHERDAAGYNPWGKGGGGAPALGADGGRLVDLRDMRADFNERLEAGHPGNPHPGGIPVESFDAQFAGGIDRREREAHAMRAGHPTGGDPTGGASGAHRRGAPPVPPRVGFARAGARGNFRQREDAHPHELEAKERAREELQRALEAQIEEKRRRKEEEKLRLEREELAEERRLAEEQERLREAFERERAEERQKALERERAEEEAYQRAANDRSARARAPGLAANARAAAAASGAAGGGAGGGEPGIHSGSGPGAPAGGPGLVAATPHQQHPHHAARPPTPPRGPTPAGARELNALRHELQQEHVELMRAMKEQNANMAILQKRAEMAEKHSAEARVELAEMRENLADQAFVSSLPGVPLTTGDPMRAHSVDVPVYHSASDPLDGPPHVGPDADYGVFMRDAAGAKDIDLGPALDEGGTFLPVIGTADDLGGALGRGMGMGAAAGSAGGRSTIRASATFDDGASMKGDSAFVFPGQTMERAPFLAGSGQIFSGPGAERPAPSVGGGGGRAGGGGVGPPTDEERGIATEVRFGDGAGPLGGADYDDGYEGSGLQTRDTDASNKIDLVYQRNAARMAALGIGGQGIDGTGAGPADPEDADQLESLLQNFLRAQRGGTPGAKIDDAAPTIEEGEFDDPNAGMHVEGAEDEDFGLGRPGTQMSMEADTRFVGSLADR